MYMMLLKFKYDHTNRVKHITCYYDKKT